MLKAHSNSLTHYSSYAFAQFHHTNGASLSDAILHDAHPRQFVQYVKNGIKQAITAFCRYRENQFNKTYQAVDYDVFKELLCDGAVGQICNTGNTTKLLDRRLRPYALIQRPSISSEGVPMSTRYFIARSYLPVN